MPWVYLAVMEISDTVSLQCVWVCVFFLFVFLSLNKQCSSALLSCHFMHHKSLTAGGAEANVYVEDLSVLLVVNLIQGVHKVALHVYHLITKV